MFISDACVTRSRHSIWACMDGVHNLSKVAAGLLNFYLYFWLFIFGCEEMNGMKYTSIFFFCIIICSYYKIILQALNAQEESQRMIAVRKAYQKAIITPTHHVEQLWKDYENFENSVSRQLVIFWLWRAFMIKTFSSVNACACIYVCLCFRCLQSDGILLTRLKDCYLNINQNITVPGLSIGSARNMLMKLIGICLLYPQLAPTRQFPTSLLMLSNYCP